MSGSTSGSATTWLQRLKQAFLRRWRVGYEHEPYLPKTPYSSGTIQAHHLQAEQQHIYRFPSPGSQPQASVPLNPPETVFDTGFYKRGQIKLTPPPGADPHEFHWLADETTLEKGELPRHLPHAWWHYDRNALKYIRKVYKESGGIVRAGVYKVKQFKQFGWDRPQYKEDYRA